MIDPHCPFCDRDEAPACRQCQTDEAAAIAVSHDGFVTAVSDGFGRQFGWEAHQLLGRPLTMIIPPHMRDAHQMGFARFLEFGKSALLGQPLQMPVLTAAGDIAMAEICIEAEQSGGQWRFSALLSRVPE